MNVREWALPVYTILMQTAAGLLTFLWFIWKFDKREIDRAGRELLLGNPLTIILFTGLVAMVGAHFHLSKPFLSLLAVLNFGSSWLSNEIAFTILFVFSILALWLILHFRPIAARSINFAGWSALLFGWVMVYCMARVYLLPTQISWDSPLTIVYYISTTLLLGSAAMTALVCMDLRFTEVRNPAVERHAFDQAPHFLVLLAMVTIANVLLETGLDLYQIAHLKAGDEPARMSLDLLLGLYKPLLIVRLGFIVIGSLWMGYAVVQLVRKHRTLQGSLIPIFVSFMFVMVGEILGRFLFYATHVRVGL